MNDFSSQIASQNYYITTTIIGGSLPEHSTTQHLSNSRAIPWPPPIHADPIAKFFFVRLDMKEKMYLIRMYI